MGKHLQIRVVATTWDPDRLEASWPNLVELVRSLPWAARQPGVLELVAALDQARNFAGWKPEVKNALEPDLVRAVALKGDLEEALFNWDPRKANTLSDQLEDLLSDLDAKVPQP